MMGLSEDQARALWRRAAELQAAAEEAAAAGAVPDALPGGDQESLSLEHVAAAAHGAGIDAQFVHVALAELLLPDGRDMRHDHWTGRWLEKLMREPPVIERERVIAAEPKVVHGSLREIATRPNWQLHFENQVGAGPLEDAVLVYRPTGRTDLAGAMFMADGRVLLITLRPHPGGTLVRIRVPLFRRGLNLLLTGGSVALFGGGTATLSGAATAALGAGAALLAAPALLGAAAGGALGLTAFRRLYSSTLRKGAAAIDMLLQAVAVEAEESRGH